MSPFAAATRGHLTATAQRAQAWLDRQDPASRRGVAIIAWQRYRAIDGPLQSLLISTYMLVAVLPALLVMEEYLDSRPTALADSLVRHYDLSRQTSQLVHSVLVQDRTHELGSALFAVAGALFFGLGIGRVLQLVHVRAWRLEPAPHATDQARYALVLLSLYGLILLLLVQLAELSGAGSWVRFALAPGWAAVLAAYFLWTTRLLTHGRIPARDVLPGALLTGVGLVVLLLVSAVAMQRWVDLYARDYGGLGVVMAVFFGIGFSSTVIVMAASLAPVLAGRRLARRESPGDAGLSSTRS
jgi:membrane protein